MSSHRIKVLDTRTVPMEQRVTKWENAVANFLVPLEIQSSAMTVTGRITRVSVDNVSICHLSASAHFGVRSEELAAGCGSENYKIAIGTKGVVALQQFGRKVVLRPGECAIYDTAEPYSVGSDVPFGVVVALIPKNSLRVRPTEIARVAAQVLSGQDRDGMRRTLLRCVNGGQSSILGEEFFSSVTSLVRETPAFRVGGHIIDADLLRRSIEIIEGALQLERLGPDYVAALLGVSRRYLYNIFTPEYGPIATYIRAKRLERARTFLASAKEKDTPIVEVAFESGFPDPAHFSRLFKGVFGLTPSEFRTLCNPEAQGESARGRVIGDRD